MQAKRLRTIKSGANLTSQVDFGQAEAASGSTQFQFKFALPLGVAVFNITDAGVFSKCIADTISRQLENGKIVKATCICDEQKLNKILDTDDGSRYIGEFAIGVNPFILHPMKDTLFDEKIAGSIHLTPGQCYDEAPNGNQSSIHWDLVLIQRADYGGGEMYFDDKLVRKDGVFTDQAMEDAFSAENLRSKALD